MECDWLNVQKNVAFELAYVDLEKDNDVLERTARRMCRVTYHFELKILRILLSFKCQ